MNRIHRIVWNQRRRAYMVAAENSSGRGKSSGTSGALLGSVLMGVSMAGSALAAAQPPDTLPIGGVVSAGQASINQSGNTLTVTQSSAKTAINWNGFSIGQNATVNFVQPGATSIALNRVTGTEGSVIDGLLNANGQVFILNPNGVLFGKGARVDTAGLVASTLGLSDADFKAGKASFSGRGGTVTNAGTLNATGGGYVALLGAQVSNNGLITATRGTVALAAGNKISLNFNGNSLVGVTVDEAALAALVANGQAIQADGGNVILTAKSADGLLDTVVNNTGEIRARTIDNQSGRIMLLGEGGTVAVGGQLDATAPTGGNGGFIETSGATLKVADGTQVSTRSALGNSGTWLIDPTDFTIASGTAAQTGSGIGATTLQTALGAGNVTIQTQSTGTDIGNININAPVSWSANKLTLEAYGDINVNAVLSATGTSTLNLKTGYNFNLGSPAFVASKNVLVGTNADGTFLGRMDFDRSGTDVLAINNVAYTLINTLGSPGSTTKTDLQGINGNSIGHFALSSNIDASATSGWNSGLGFTSLTYGSGAVFDGLGHTVNGLTINQPSGSYLGLFGQSSGTLRNVGVTNASVSSNQAGGILAGLQQGSAFNDYVTGTVSGPGGYMGGMFGAIFDGTFNNLHAAATVSSAGNNVGGLVGYLAYQILLSNTFATGNVTGTGTWTGGLVGQNDYGYISNSTASGNVSGHDQTGGLVGSNNSGRIIGSSANGTVTGTTNAGGLVGENNNGLVMGSEATGNVNGTRYVGGLIGQSVQRGGVTAANTISTSYATGNVTGTLTDSEVGGLIGFNSGNAVTNTYARGAVNGVDSTGGLIGKNAGTVTNGYATGAVTSSGTGVGGLAGASTGTITNSFWDTETTGLSTSVGGGTGKTTAQMLDSTLFTNATWDFTFHSGVWGQKSTLNNGFPVLRTFGYTDPITITLDSLSASRSYGVANPALGATGWTVSGCDNNATCLSAVNWGTAASATTGVGSYGYGAANVLAPTLGTGYGKLSDYDITYTIGSLTISPAMLSVTGMSAATKTYDRSNSATLVGGTLAGLQNGETLTLSMGAATFDSANAGNRTASASSSISNGNGPNAGLASNYQLASATVTGVSGFISPLAVNLVGQTSKTYDGLAASDASLLAITNVISGDSVALSGTATLAAKDVGVQAIAGVTGLSLNNSNYTLAGATTSVGVTVTPRTLDVQVPAGATRLYDGTTVADASLLDLSGVVAGDSVIAGGSATLAGKDVGTQAVTGMGSLALNNGNYTLSGATATGQVGITALPVTVSAVFNAGRVYDASAGAGANLLQIDNVVGGDSVALSGNATLASRDVGNQALVTLGGLALNNTNYTLIGATPVGSVQISPRAVSIVANNGASQVYDGSTLAASGLLAVNGLMGSDSATLSGSATLAARNVGNEALVGLGSLALSNGNYTLTGVAPAGTVAVTPLTVDVVARPGAIKPYDGTIDAAASLFQLDGLLAGDTATLSGSATLSGLIGETTVASLGSLALANTNYTLAGAGASGSIRVIDVSGGVAATIAPAQRVDVPGRVEMLAEAGLHEQAATGASNFLASKVLTTPPNLAASFGPGVPLELVGSVSADEKSEVVTLEQARRMAVSAGAASDLAVRVPVSRNSLAAIVNGGVKLPGGVDQLLFVVKGN